MNSPAPPCLGHPKPDNEFIFPDGGRGWFRLIIQPVAEGIAIFAEDITERKQVEEVINKLNAELERLNRLFVGRELSMRELKARIVALERRPGNAGPLRVETGHDT